MRLQKAYSISIGELMHDISRPCCVWHCCWVVEIPTPGGPSSSMNWWDPPARLAIVTRTSISMLATPTPHESSTHEPCAGFAKLNDATDNVVNAYISQHWWPTSAQLSYNQTSQLQRQQLVLPLSYSCKHV